MTNFEHRFLDAKRAGEILNVCATRVGQLRNQGLIESIGRVGPGHVYDRVDVAQLAAKRAHAKALGKAAQ